MHGNNLQAIYMKHLKESKSLGMDEYHSILTEAKSIWN